MIEGVKNCAVHFLYLPDWQSGPHQENRQPRNSLMQVTLMWRAHKTWPSNVSTKRDKLKLWGPALYCDDLASFIRNSLTLWQPCAARIKDLMSFYNGPTFTVLVKLRRGCLGPLLKEQRNSVAKECGTKQKRGPAITRGSIFGAGFEQPFGRLIVQNRQAV